MTPSPASVRRSAARGNARGTSIGESGVPSAPMSQVLVRSSQRASRTAILGASAAAILAICLAACGTISRTPPLPTPADFQGIAGDIVLHGIAVSHVVSGDAGCPDADLAKTAIAFDASGLDQASPVRLYLYVFRNRETYERLRSTIDGCAATYVTDPESYESVETSPYVVSGQGPWGPQFKDNLRSAIVQAAGTGN